MILACNFIDITYLSYHIQVFHQSFICISNSKINCYDHRDSVTSAHYDAWKVWSDTSLLDYTKLKKGNGALRDSRAYLHNSMMPNNMARLLHWVGISLLELDPSHVSIWSCISTTCNR